MKKLTLTAFMAAFAFTAFAAGSKNDSTKCDPASCKSKTCCDKAGKMACKDHKGCKDTQACKAKQETIRP